MLRRLVGMLVLLCVGVLATVLVAWRCVNVQTNVTIGLLADEELAELCERYPLNVPGGSRTDGWLQHRFGLRQVVATSGMYGLTDEERYLTLTNAGWPMTALSGTWFGTATQTQRTSTFEHTIRVPLDRVGPYWGVLPYRPLLLGLVVDTLFYAGLTWGLVAVAGRVRRRWRTDRDRCPRCAHGLLTPGHGDAVVCQECGTATTARCFTRPRQLVRRWWLPLLAPSVAWAAIEFGRGVDWSRLRFELRYMEPIVSFWSLATLAVAVTWVYVVALRSLADRRRAPRIALSCVVAVTLTLPAYLAVFAFAVQWARGG